MNGGVKKDKKNRRKTKWRKSPCQPTTN
ncbi:not available [Bacillus cereus]|nr:not available [Bacillus cereus]